MALSAPPLIRFGTLVHDGRKAFWVAALATFLLDHATKVALWSHPGAGRPDIVIIPHVLRLISHPGNTQGALGLGPSNPLFFVGAAALGLAVIVWFFLSTDPGHWVLHAALGLLAGGAVGNLLDRLAFKFVRDFIDLHWKEAFHWHTFNVADAAICAGFVIVVWDAFRGGRRAQGAGGQAEARDGK